MTEECDKCGVNISRAEKYENSGLCVQCAREYKRSSEVPLEAWIDEED